MKNIFKALVPNLIKRKIRTLFSLVNIKLNGQYVQGLLVQTGDFHLLVTPDDMSVGRDLRNNGTYGKDELRRISKLISINSSIVFVGTHIGSLAIPTARKVKSCIFIEANPFTFKLLTMNVAINKIPNAHCHNVAVGEREGEIKFVVSTYNSGGSKREPIFKDPMYYYDNPSIISVPMVTLDSIFSDQGGNLDLVFMDIEGSEMFALKGMDNVLNLTKALIIEFIPHHLRNVANCSVEDFIGLLAEYFSHCYVPSKGKYLQSDEFINFFSKMFSLDETEDGLVFTKEFVDFSP